MNINDLAEVKNIQWHKVKGPLGMPYELEFGGEIPEWDRRPEHWYHLPYNNANLDFRNGKVMHHGYAVNIKAPGATSGSTWGATIIGGNRTESMLLNFRRVKKGFQAFTLSKMSWISHTVLVNAKGEIVKTIKFSEHATIRVFFLNEELNGLGWDLLRPVIALQFIEDFPP